MKYKIVRKNKHIPDCGAMRSVREGRWKTPWAYPEMTWANKFANKTPSGRGYIAWLKVRCNDTHCPAEIWIPNNDFVAGLPKE